MAQGSRLHCAPRRKLSPADFVEDELAGAPPGALTEKSRSPLTSLVPLCTLTPCPAPSPPAPALLVTTPAPGPTEDLFRQFIQAYMEDRWNTAPAPPPLH